MNSDGIRIERLAFRIGDFVMQDLCLTVRRGEYFVLTGPNGAGKTVLLKLIAGLHRPQAGTIWIQGEAVTDLPPWKRNIGAVPQDGLLFPNRNVRDNIAFGLEVRHLNRRARDAAVEQIASKLSISHLLQRRPETLSAGERQKVSLARALVLRPPVLLLDEPISAVDEKTRDNLLCRELRAIQRDSGITTVHVAHNRQEIELVADRVGYLEAGRLRDIVEIAPGDIRLKPRGAEDG